jgi:hypothetical protein
MITHPAASAADAGAGEVAATEEGEWFVITKFLRTGLVKTSLTLAAFMVLLISSIDVLLSPIT